MNEDDVFSMLARHSQRIFNPNFCNEFFSEEEECPYGNAVYCSIEKSISIYRARVTQEEIPTDVSARLHMVIKKQWLRSTRHENDEGR